MIDRWDTITNTWIFHSSKEQVIKDLFQDKKENSNIDSIKSALQVIIKHATELRLSKDLIDLANIDLQNLLEKEGNTIFSIWGANVYFTDNIENDVAIGLSLNLYDKTLIGSDSNNLTDSIIVFNV